MKKIATMFSPIGIAAIALIAGVYTTGCNSNDYNKGSQATTDSMSLNHDTAMAVGRDTTSLIKRDSGMTMHGDTNMHSNMTPAADTIATMRMSKDSMAKPAKAKPAKKGKVSVIMSKPSTQKNVAMEMDKEGFYTNTEVLPSFPGGQKALERFFEKNVQYPEAATENDAQGTVKLSFLVDESGKIYQPVATGNKIGYGLEEEAIRVFNKMPVWTPGKIKGKNVKSRFTLPVNFQLN